MREGSLVGEKSQNLCPETIAPEKKILNAIKRNNETARRMLWILMGNVH